MTLNELQSEVQRLAFTDELYSYDAFLQATNRAIYRTRSVFPKKKRVKIANFPIPNILGESVEKVYTTLDEIAFYGNDVAAYYFEAQGEGHADFYYRVSDDLELNFEPIFTVPLSSSSGFKQYKGFVKRFGQFSKGSFKLVFRGDLALSVKNIALYDCLLTPNESDIPQFSAERAIDLKRETETVRIENGLSVIKSDFMSISAPITLYSSGKRCELLYRLVGSELLVSSDCIGEIEIEYIAIPDTVGVSSKGIYEPDFPEEVSAFAAYLIASNLLLEEEPELSTQYFSRYLEAESYAKSLCALKCGVYEYTGGEI